MKRQSERDREFTEFVTARRAVLTHVATLLLSGDRGRAEDAVQTALTRLYLAWPRVRPETVDAYARRCVVNAAIDDRRSLFRRRERIQADLPDAPSTAEAQYVDRSSLVALLAALPARMRAAVVLRYIEDLTVAETAAALRCSEGTVKSQSARGLERLRRAYPQDSHNYV